MRKTLLITLIAIIVLGTMAVVYGSCQYTDIQKANWAYDAVAAMADKAVIKGYPDGSFKPNNTVTYGEFIKMAIVAATGEDAGNANAPDNWAKNYYDKALELKYFTEYDIHKSQLSHQIPRGDMALIIGSILGDVIIENYDTIQDRITDVTVKTEYEYDITKAFATGILTGYTDNTFKPNKTLSRAESATVIYRLVDESKRQLPEVGSNELPAGGNNELPGAGKEGEATTIERLNGENESGTVNLADSSISTLPIEDIATNIRDYKSFNKVMYYEIIRDYPYNMSIFRNLVGSESILIDNVDYSRGAILINGNTMLPLQSVGGKIYYVAGQADGSKLPVFDYIGFYNPSLVTLILVANPL